MQMAHFDPVTYGKLVSGTNPWISSETNQATPVNTYLRPGS